MEAEGGRASSGRAGIVFWGPGALTRLRVAPALLRGWRAGVCVLGHPEVEAAAWARALHGVSSAGRPDPTSVGAGGTPIRAGGLRCC